MNTLEHLAIIMDGNGRWAKAQNLPRAKGHEQGARVVREVTECAAKHGVKTLTLYAFSTENWSRPKTEIDFLMKLLATFLKKERANLLKDNVRFKTIGDLRPFSPALKKEIQALEAMTEACTGITQVLALNYGGQDELVRAANTLRNAHSPITKASLEAALDLPSPVDLLIRTGGEMRLSNFLLWQAAYAELRFSSTLWPDFTCKELEHIITSFTQSHRRFGGL